MPVKVAETAAAAVEEVGVVVVAEESDLPRHHFDLFPHLRSEACEMDPAAATISCPSAPRSVEGALEAGSGRMDGWKQARTGRERKDLSKKGNKKGGMGVGHY